MDMMICHIYNKIHCTKRLLAQQTDLNWKKIRKTGVGANWRTMLKRTNTYIYTIKLSISKNPQKLYKENRIR